MDIIRPLGLPSYTPRHWVPILVAFYDVHGLQLDYPVIKVIKYRRIRWEGHEARMGDKVRSKRLIFCKGNSFKTYDLLESLLAVHL